MSPPVPKDRFLGCLLGEAVGDGLGALYEGLPADFIYWSQGAVADLLSQSVAEGLRYTDDTQMMIGVAEVLAAHGRIDEDDLIRRFAADYDPERGYGTGARRILEGVNAGNDWRHLAENLFPGGSFGNGAAMRVAPVGLFFAHDLDRVAAEARASARPTHRHPLGIEGAVLLAVAVALASRGPPFERGRFYRTLEGFCESDEFCWQVRAARGLRRGHSLGFLGNSLPAYRSVVTAIACFSTSPDSYEGAVGTAVTQGDDTDTLAAMAGALSGAHLGIDAVPRGWVERLEEGPKGATYLRGLAERLHERYSLAFAGGQPG